VQSAGSKSPLGSEFDKFLFAPLGEDENGLSVSIVSLFARLNLDPWREAGDLAALPADVAARRLIASLETLTDPMVRGEIAESMVPRLLALLPRRIPGSAQAPPVPDLPAAVHAGTRLGTLLLIISALVLLGSRLFASHGFAPGPAAVVHGPAALSNPSQTLPKAP
jgi:hypothetical protein